MPLIRSEQSADLAAIHRVNELAFGQPAEANVVDALRHKGKTVVSLVALEDDKVVGHILFSPVTIEAPDRIVNIVGLAPMAVLPAYQKSGIGSALVKAGLEECQKAGHSAVVVLGHPEYYPRFGFVPASRFGLKSEYVVPDEVFMAMELQAGALSGCRGVAKYQPEFNEI
jgi:putative acetyltransferase